MNGYDINKEMGKIRIAFVVRRKHLGLTQTQLAELAGVTQVTISTFEGGKRALTLESFLRIANVLGYKHLYNGEADHTN